MGSKKWCRKGLHIKTTLMKAMGRSKIGGLSIDSFYVLSLNHVVKNENIIFRCQEIS